MSQSNYNKSASGTKYQYDWNVPANILIDSYVRVSVPEFLSGSNKGKSLAGYEYTLTEKDIRGIFAELRRVTGTKQLTMPIVHKLRMKLEFMMYKHRDEFSDWKDNLDWAMSKLGITAKMLYLVLYPTEQDYFGIAEYKNILT